MIRCVTAADVALEAGVERSTVSRILGRTSAGHRYAPATVRAVEAAARRLNYQPSATAVALRTGRTMLVGMLVGDIANPFFGELAARVEAALQRHGYRLQICNSGEDPARQRQHLADLLHRKVDGLIIAPAGDDGLQTVRRANVAAVLIDRPASRAVGPLVAMDNARASQLLGEHLASLGYQRIGVVTLRPAGDVTLAMRLEGLSRAGASSLRVEWVHHLDSPCEIDDRLADRLRAENRVEAVIGLTNDSTMAACTACRRAGLSIPGDVGVAGIDDFRAATLLDPPVTVVAQPLDAIAQGACNRLIKRMQQAGPVEDLLLAPTLVGRSSLRMIRGAS